MKPAILHFLIPALLVFAPPANAARPRLPSAVVRALNAPTAEATLYSLHPDPGGFPWFSRTFHGYRILGEFPLADSGQRQQVVATVREAAQTYLGDTKCMFSPRHGLRLTSGGQTYDFVICFECWQMEVYSGPQRLVQLSIGGSPDTLNRILRAARIRSRNELAGTVIVIGGASLKVSGSS